MRRVKKQQLQMWFLISLLLIAGTAATLICFFDQLEPKHKEALTLWGVVMTGLSTFLLVLAVVYQGENVVGRMKEDEAAANSCACSNDRKG